MLAFVVRRLLWAVALCLILSIVTFIVFYVIPTQQVQVRGGGFTDLQRASQLNGPVAEQYAQWMWHVGHGSMGQSFFSRQDVNSIIGNAAPVTIWLTLGGAVLWMLIAIPLGVVSALRPRSLIDRGATALVLLGISVHPLWLGLACSWLFGFKLHVLPSQGYCDLIKPATTCGGPVPWFTHMLMPWFVFSLVFAALYVRMIRASVTESLQEDYVRSAYAKGHGEWGTVRGHVLPNAMLPVVAMLAMDIARFALPTALFVETAFGLPGLGRVLYDSLLRNDLPVLVGTVVFIALAVVVLNLIADIAYALLDPRVQLRGDAIPI